MRFIITLMMNLKKAAEEERYDFVTDILVRYRNVKQIYGFKLKTFWSNIASVEDYYNTNMAWLRPDVRRYFKEGARVYSKVADLPPAKYNPGSEVSDSLISSGCIVNGKIEKSILFRQVFVGKNCVIRNAIIMDGAYIGDNTHVENCIVERNVTLKPNSFFSGDGEILVITEQNEKNSL